MISYLFVDRIQPMEITSPNVTRVTNDPRRFDNPEEHQNVTSCYGIDVAEDRFSYSGTRTYIQFKELL